MLEQARDLKEEGLALHDFLETLEEGDWDRITPFKSWTVYDVIAHLHFFDRLSLLSLRAPDEFLRAAEALARALQRGGDLASYPREQIGPRAPGEMLGLWRDDFMQMCDLLGEADPKLRLRWFGPDMGVRAFASARQMETWAHGQEIYDLLRVKRTNTDRIKNIAVLGVKTFGWTFANRGLEIPAEVPFVRLNAPSGDLWEWGEPCDENRVEGLAVDFCHVVTQGRHVADTGLQIVGETATRWMAIAQCFAGGPADPPKPGERAWG